MVLTNQDSHKLQESRGRVALSIAALLMRHHFIQIYVPDITYLEFQSQDNLSLLRSQQLSQFRGQLLRHTDTGVRAFRETPSKDQAAPANQGTCVSTPGAHPKTEPKRRWVLLCFSVTCPGMLLFNLPFIFAVIIRQCNFHNHAFIIIWVIPPGNYARETENQR